ncbi:unnamed protein product [Meloidogyne enterolobii]|uniref:Uncharacterized protein n=1 Tax=Meloidogyne enterolobii TaxID=390850 RepID=A0ACB1AUC1_MELEN
MIEALKGHIEEETTGNVTPYFTPETPATSSYMPMHESTKRKKKLGKGIAKLGKGFSKLMGKLKSKSSGSSEEKVIRLGRK